jgi:hypothetical protein
MRWIWDVYDVPDDSGQELVQEGASTTTFGRMFDVFASYGAGTGTFKRDEPWNSSYSGFDALDGRALASWSTNYQTAYGTIITDPGNINCGAP